MDRMELVAAVAAFCMLMFTAGWVGSRLMRSLTGGSEANPAAMRELAHDLETTNHKLEQIQSEAASRIDQYEAEIALHEQKYARLLDEYRQLQSMNR